MRRWCIGCGLRATGLGPNIGQAIAAPIALRNNSQQYMIDWLVSFDLHNVDVRFTDAADMQPKGAPKVSAISA